MLNPAQNTIITCDASTASGSAVATLTGKTFCIFLSYTGIAQETESHIHGPAPIGSGAEVLFALSGKANKRDCFAFNTTHVQWLNDGLLYANIHSANFAGGCLEGEIRGQILPAISRKKGHKHL